MTPPPPAPALPDPVAAEALAADLRDYTVAAIEAELGPVAARALEREESLPARRALASSGEPVARLFSLFQLGAELTRAEVEAAAPRTGVAGLERLGLVRTAGAGRGDEVRAAVELSPYSAQVEEGEVDWWIASDPGEVARGGAVLPTSHVLGVGGASRTLAQLTVREPRERVLDLGTGCGIQALHAAAHAREVVATDIDERALAFARFNAALNLPPQAGSVTTRAGSMLEPVAGERFDLVVSNPPFVITPRGAGVAEFTYRDGGASGDDLVRTLLRSLPTVLAPGGVAQLLGNWEHRRSQPWNERVSAWVADLGLDAWIIQREVQDPAEYAELWLRDGGLTADRDRAGYERAYEAWLADLASREVEGVGFGFLTLRRPAGGGAELRSPWIRVEEITGSVQQPLGATVSGVLAAVDRWSGASAADLLAQHWVVASDVTEERFFTPGEASPSVILLRAGGGFGRTVRCDTALAAFVGACDGDLSGGQIVAALAGLLEVEAAALVAQIVPQLRGLVLDGLLLDGPVLDGPADTGSGAGARP